MQLVLSFCAVPNSLTYSLRMQLLLARWSSQSDVVVGVPSLGRSSAQLEHLVGTFINMLPLRTSLPEESSFAELLSGVRSTLLAAFRHSELPFHKLVEVVGAPRAMSHTPIFQAIIALNDVESELLESSLCARQIKPEVCSKRWLHHQPLIFGLYLRKCRAQSPSPGLQF